MVLPEIGKDQAVWQTLERAVCVTSFERTTVLASAVGYSARMLPPEERQRAGVTPICRLKTRWNAASD